MNTLKYSFKIEFSYEDDSWITTCPALPGLSTFGDTPEKSLAEAQSVLPTFLEVVMEAGPAPEFDLFHRLPIPRKVT